ncbi:hypothetical protein BCV69DRAFT_295409 [Microstroma glucosiphilum]|uniref:Prephenate dehydratase domain-containing protein n=1 Tax=Pseudomicrostroma glucosiphilum TaxID=1684307 RepID=A0A316TY68_9BASI|nr:hypothetical protein BCV69DRAFT_295409 [Pseudomicrostroma glucosiphilum]PWN18259.1 hypothetical protein BCV69DRAFT_295409 [Pseudomicrostroma glucosiphilum]
MSDQHRPSPTPSAFSSTLPPSFRARLRIRPHAPLPTEPFLLPINIPSAASFPSLGNTDTSQDDLSFLAGRIVSHVPQARSELPQPTDLALYLDGFRLTGWDTKLSDLIRDGDVIDVHHVTRLPSSRHDVGRSSSHKKRKRRREYSDSYELDDTCSSQSSASSSRHRTTRTKSKRTRRERIADQREGRQASRAMPPTSRLGKSALKAPDDDDDDLQAEADRIALLIKSEIGGATPVSDAGGRPSNRTKSSPHHRAIEQEEEGIDELPKPPPGLLSTIPLPSRSSIPPVSKALPPAMPLPPSGVGGAAAAMAAFEARKRETQSAHRDSTTTRASSALSTMQPTPRTASNGHTKSDSNVVHESDSEAEDASSSSSASASASSSSSSLSSESDNEVVSRFVDGKADKGLVTASAQSSGLSSPSSSSSSESSSASDARSSGSNTKLTPASASSSLSDPSSLDKGSGSDANDSASSLAPGDQPNSLNAQALSALNAATNAAASSSWVVPGQGSKRTRRGNAKKRTKSREKMRASQERMFNEAQERAKQREAGQAMTNGAATSVIGEATQEPTLNASTQDKTQKSDDAPVAGPSGAKKAHETTSTAERAQSPFATILTYSNDDDDPSEGADAGSVFGWSLDVTPTTPMIPYRDPKAALQPPTLLKNNAAIKLDLAKKEREMLELKKKIRKAEEQRKTLPPGGGMFELDFAVESDKHTTEAKTNEVPTANTQALPTSSVVPFTFARPAPVHVGQALASQVDKSKNITAPPIAVRTDGPPPTKKARKALRPLLQQPPHPSTLPPSEIPPNIKLTSVDCEAWYNGEEVHEYLFVPGGQEEKGRASVSEELEEGEVLDTEDEGTKAYLLMRRAVREDLRKEKELEAKQAAFGDVIETQASLALHPHLPLTFSSLKDVRPSREVSQAPQASTEAKPTATKPASTVTVGAVTPTNGQISPVMFDALPTEFGTNRTRAKQLAGKTGRSPKIPPSEVKSTATASATSATNPAAEVELAYLGPPGTYSHQVALNLDIPALLESQPGKRVVLKGKGPEVVDLHPCSTITQTLERALQAKEGVSAQKPYRLALLPFANSTFGPVKETASLLAEYKDKMNVLAATELKVQHSLLVSEATYKALESAGDISSGKVKQSAFAKIQRVYSHEQAIGQCDMFLKKNLPLTSTNGGRTPVASTALAASLVASNGRMQAQGDTLTLKMEAAIASEICATKGVIPGLRLLKVGIQDKDDNTTKFIIVEAATVPTLPKSSTSASASASADGGDKQSLAPTAGATASTPAPAAPAPVSIAQSTSASLPARPSVPPPPSKKAKAVHPDFFPGTSSLPDLKQQGTANGESSATSTIAGPTAGASATSALPPLAPPPSLSSSGGGLDYGDPEEDGEYYPPAGSGASAVATSGGTAAGSGTARRISARSTRNIYATKPGLPAGSATTPPSMKPAVSAKTLTGQDVSGPEIAAATAAATAANGRALPSASAAAPAPVPAAAPAPLSISSSTSLSVDETLRLARERALASLKLKKSAAGTSAGGSAGEQKNQPSS